MNRKYSYLKEIFGHLIDNASELELDGYKRLVIQRIKNSMNASIFLIENNYPLESPVQHRVAVEHALRLRYLHVTPKNELNLNIYKALAKRTPTISNVAKEAGIYELYSFLCAFAHPDIISLTLAESEPSSHLYSISENLACFAYLVINSMLFELYPQLQKIIDLEEYGKKFLSFMVSLPQDTLNQVLSTKESLNNENIQLITEIFDKTEVGEIIPLVYKDLMQGNLTPERIEELMNGGEIFSAARQYLNDI